MDSRTTNYITGDPAFAVDRDGVILLWNEAAEESLGVPGSDALGKKCWQLLCGEDDYGNRRCCEHCPIREMALRHEPVHSFHATFKTNSHQHEQFEVSCLTIFDEPGNEILLHICHPETRSVQSGYDQSASKKHTEALSQREVEVLGLLADKVSTKDIAARLAISIRTVRTHIQHLMYKLHVHKRKEAIQIGKRLNLI